MKHIHRLRDGLLLLLCFLAVGNVIAQTDSTKPDISVNIHHLVVNNSFQYLLIETKIKIDKKWKPLKGQVLQLYLDSNKAQNLIAKVQTDSAGKAKAIIPSRLKSIWDLTSTHKFIAVTEGTFKEEETTTESEISKAKILIDTSNTAGIRTVNVQVMKWESNDWMPAKDVEIKIGIRRSGGDLKIGDEESYTTDSLGQVAGEFKRDSLPGDQKNNLTIIAKIEDNDNYGSLSIEKTVPWGISIKPSNNFDQRALWAARGKAPVWLMLMAYSIMAAVWGVILYLILQISKISKLGKREANKTPVLTEHHQ